MEKSIYDVLNYIKNNNRVPSCDVLNLSQERLNQIIKKCNVEGLLDKELIFVNILGTINASDNVDMAITIKGLNFLDEYNPVGKVQ